MIHPTREEANLTQEEADRTGTRLLTRLLTRTTKEDR